MDSFLKTLGISSAAALLSALVSLIVCAIVIKLLMKLVDRVLGGAKKIEGTLKGFVRGSVHILLWIIAVTIVFNALGVNTSSLVALVSVVGLALSLSVQNILTNLFSGLTLLTAKPFTAGDYVEAAGRSGVVKAVGLFYTQLSTLDNVDISIPNGDVAASTVVNYSRETLRRVDRCYTVSYDAPTETVKAAVLEAVRRDGRILSEPAPFVRLSAFLNSTVEFTVRVWCRNSDYWDVLFTLNENVRETFAAHGVEFSYEHMNVHIET